MIWIINVYQSETGTVAFVLLKVVGERPNKIASDIHTVFFGFQQVVQIFFEKRNTVFIVDMAVYELVIEADAVFGYNHCRLFIICMFSGFQDKDNVFGNVIFLINNSFLFPEHRFSRDYPHTHPPADHKNLEGKPESVVPKMWEKQVKSRKKNNNR